jgi:hypothetical protein
MLKPETVKQLRRELEKLENWEREIEASCPHKFNEEVDPYQLSPIMQANRQSLRLQLLPKEKERKRK